MRFGAFIDVNKLATIFLNLQSKGAHNINLVTPTIYVPYIIEAIDIARGKGLRIPIVYNTSSYEKTRNHRAFERICGHILARP